MSGWRIGGASVRGAAHVQSGQPNQDALHWTPGVETGCRIVGALADGHGSAAHFRSDIGARFAVDSAAELIARHLEDEDACADEGALAGEILRLWRSRVERHLIAHPLDTLDVLLLNGSPYTPYGATLVAVGANDDRIVMLQIGDGDLILGFADGRIERPLPPDEGLTGEQTWSLCLDGAERRFRWAAISRTDEDPAPDFVMLVSDGVSKSYRDETALETAIRELRRRAHDDWEGALAALSPWLKLLSELGSGDDSTACLAVRAADSKNSGGETNHG
jgi:serine/threonine protein phosphatase PrpC